MSPAITSFRESPRALLASVEPGKRLPPLFLMGEGGSGKHRAASVVHRACSRASGPFLSRHVAAIPESIVDYEVRGLAPGGFNCTADHAGAVGLANRGTLLLEEVALLPDELWPWLTRLVESGTSRQLGGLESEEADVQIIVTSSCWSNVRIGSRWS